MFGCFASRKGHKRTCNVSQTQTVACFDIHRSLSPRWRSTRRALYLCERLNWSKWIEMDGNLWILNIFWRNTSLLLEVLVRGAPLTSSFFADAFDDAFPSWASKTRPLNPTDIDWPFSVPKFRVQNQSFIFDLTSVTTPSHDAETPRANWPETPKALQNFFQDYSRLPSIFVPLERCYFWGLGSSKISYKSCGGSVALGKS